jgi:hypothetical protein
MSQRASGFERQDKENYPTPSWVTRLIIPHLPGVNPFVWEPAAGDGKMVKAFRSAGVPVSGTTKDFLKQTLKPLSIVNAIVTNPPYGTQGRLALKFIEHALEFKPSMVAMLLRADFDSGKTRTHIFRDEPRWHKKIVLLDRINWFEGPGLAGSSTNHAWYIWKYDNTSPPVIEYVRRALK